MTGTIFNFPVREKVAETGRSIIYRIAYRGGTAILKVLKAAAPSLSDIARFKQEYAILTRLNIDGVITPYEIIDAPEGLAIVQEDFPGRSVKDLLSQKKPFNLQEFFTIAVTTARILGDIHQVNVVHKDIKPANILATPSLDQIKITDFGISSIFSGENEEIFRRDVIEGTLVYMSPEQTGRLNRDLDYRTDLYSLGIMFYELLTGVLPFQSDDPMEIIYSHIARRPVSVSEVNPEIPETISAIIDKLLAKTPEERYQNAYGLMHDLEECRQSFLTKGRVEPFPIALADISPRFNIPQIVVGREKEIQELTAVFERFLDGSREIVFVTGAAGIGKSALVMELYKPITARRGYFISGKYDQFRRDVPYSAIIQAFQQLVRQVLAEDQSKIEFWRSELTAALGANARLLIDVIPELEHILGPHPPVEPLGPEEALNRFNMVFKNFISVFATHDHPVAIFLDDCQWMDLASISLMQSLVTDDSVRHLFLIGSYREMEVEAFHPLNTALQSLQDNGVAIHTIAVPPINEDNVQELLLNFLKTKESSIPDLAHLIFSKTAGNPFFVIQFLKRLYEQKLIRFSPERGWYWDVEEIRSMPITDNVVDMLVQAIGHMPEDIRDCLMVCACIGNRFRLEDIAEVTGESMEQLLPKISSLMEYGLIGIYKNTYRFHHDRIQEAAYSLMDEERRTRLHYAIATSLLAKTASDELHDKIFYIVQHMNRSVSLADEAERIRIAELNLLAGTKAKSSAAFDAALTYFRQGSSLLPADMWEAHYNLTFALHINMAECEYLAGSRERAMELFEAIFKKARTRLEKAEVYINRSLLLTNYGRYDDAVRFGLEGLRLFGIRLSEKPGIFSLAKEIIRLKLKLAFLKVESLVNLPIMEDPENVAAIRIFESVSQAGYYTNKNLTLIAPMKLFQIMLRHGLCYLSPYVCGVIAGILGPGLGDYRNARRFYDLSNKLLDRIHNVNIGNVYFVQAYLYLHWNRHASENLALFRKAYSLFLELGKFDFACHSLNNIVDYSFVMGKNLDEIFGEYQKYESFFKKHKDRFFRSYFDDNIRKYQCYKGLTDSPTSFNKGDCYDEDRLREIRETSNKLDKFIYLINLMKIEYLCGSAKKALAYAEEVAQFQDELIGNFHYPEFVMYYDLILSSLARERAVSRGRRCRLHRRLSAKMKKWADVCEPNYLHKYCLMMAEGEALRGRYECAVEWYHRAISEASKNQYLNNEALANERLGEFYAAKGDEVSAAVHLSSAYRLYQRWGAAAKAELLRNKHGDAIAQARPGRGEKDTGDTSTLSTSKTTGSLDFSSALKAAIAVSGELALDRLLEKLLTIMMENAGAEKGFLILHTDGVLTVEARGDMQKGELRVLENIPLDETEGLSPAIVRFAARTGEPVILAHAAEDRTYGSDPHIFKNKIRSLLCLPIINQGKVTAVLYLENNLTTGAFTPQRIELLTIFSAQAAIAIDNARLYSNLEKKVEERTRELKQARDALWGEMKLASKIQSVLIPKSPSARGYELFGYMAPAAEVGGDYYDVINSREADWLIIGDVAGHGVTAGLVMMMAQTSLQTIIRATPSISPVMLLKTANRALSYNMRQMNEDKYMTITVLKLYPDGRIEHAGLHQNILVYRAAAGSVERHETDGMWLGFDIDLGRPNRIMELGMGKGDLLLLFTDGITEAKNESGEEFGEARLARVLEQSGGLALPAIKDAIFASLSGFRTNDDMTVLMARRMR